MRQALDLQLSSTSLLIRFDHCGRLGGYLLAVHDIETPQKGWKALRKGLQREEVPVRFPSSPDGLARSQHKLEYGLYFVG